MNCCPVVQGNAELDLAGSLVDADMGAYYNWLNQQRLPGAGPIRASWSGLKATAKPWRSAPPSRAEPYPPQ